jgi:hypothetical protein
VRVKLQTEKVTSGPHYMSTKLGCTIEHANDFVVDLAVYTEDGCAAGLLVESDWTAIWRPSKFADKPVAGNFPVGNEVFVDCMSELERQSMERCLFARGRAARLPMLIENRGLNVGLASVSWTLRGANRGELTFMLMCVRWMMQSSGFLKVVECWRETVGVDVSIVGRLKSGVWN